MDYSSVVMELPDLYGNMLLRFSQEHFAEKDLADKLPIPHITVKYGIVEESLEAIADTIGLFKPATIVLGKMGVFVADSNRDSDVVKLDVELNPARSTILRIRESLETMECVDTYTNYYPHITLAYVTATWGLNYITEAPLIGEQLTIGSVVIKNKHGQRARLFGCGEYYEY